MWPVRWLGSRPVADRPRHHAAMLVCALLGGAGCYRLDLLEGQFTCARGDTRCPEGFACDSCSLRCLLPEHVGGTCTDGGTLPDLAPTMDFTGMDLVRLPDLTVPPDLLGMDLTKPPDLSQLPDQIGMDLVKLPDLTVPPDLLGMDLTTPPDLRPPPDMAVPPDLAPPPDFTGMVVDRFGLSWMVNVSQPSLGAVYCSTA